MEETVNKVEDDVSAFAREINGELFKGARSPEENRRVKAELNLGIQQKRAANSERRMATLKEQTKRILKGEIADE